MFFFPWKATVNRVGLASVLIGPTSLTSFWAKPVCLRLSKSEASIKALLRFVGQEGFGVGAVSAHVFCKVRFFIRTAPTHFD